ncbi:unnamed protein product, partial [Urochloa humidicola]
ASAAGHELRLLRAVVEEDLGKRRKRVWGRGGRGGGAWRPDPAPARAAAVPRAEDTTADGGGGRGANLLGATFFEGEEEEDLGKQMARIVGGNRNRSRAQRIREAAVSPQRIAQRAPSRRFGLGARAL